MWPWVLGWYLGFRFADRMIPIPASWLPTITAIMVALPVAGLLSLAWQENRRLTQKEERSPLMALTLSSDRRPIHQGTPGSGN